MIAWVLAGVLAVADVVLAAVVLSLVRSQERMTRAISASYRAETEPDGRRMAHYSMYKTKLEGDT